MFLSIDPENLKSVAQNAQRVNADIDIMIGTVRSESNSTNIPYKIKIRFVF